MTAIDAAIIYLIFGFSFMVTSVVVMYRDGDFKHAPISASIVAALVFVLIWPTAIYFKVQRWLEKRT